MDVSNTFNTGQFPGVHTIRPVHLTNLGKLTLTKLSNMERRRLNGNRDELYADLKQARMASLWPQAAPMHQFQSEFMSYGKDFILSFKNGQAVKVFQNGSTVEIESEMLQVWQRLGMVDFTAQEEPMSDLVQVFQNARDNFVRNPLKHLEVVVIELTGLCNLSCHHCFRAGSHPDEPGLDVDILKSALKPLLMAGLQSIAFTGGEPTLRANAMFEVIDYANKHMVLDVDRSTYFQSVYGCEAPSVEQVLAGLPFCLSRPVCKSQMGKNGFVNMPNGERLSSTEELDRYFQKMAEKYLAEILLYPPQMTDSVTIISNGTYDDPEDLLRKAHAFGNVQFSLSLDDFEKDKHDANRRRKGLFDNVLRFIDKAREIGVRVAIKALDLSGILETAAREEIIEPIREKAWKMEWSAENYPIGNAAADGLFVAEGEGEFNFDSISARQEPQKGWCKAFIRPSQIIIRPTGNVGNCFFGYFLPTEFGNLHHASMETILNGFEHSLPFSLFSQRRIESAKGEIDANLFPKAFKSSCIPIAIVHLYLQLKLRLIASGIPEQQAIMEANQTTAKMFRFIN